MSLELAVTRLARESSVLQQYVKQKTQSTAPAVAGNPMRDITVTIKRQTEATARYREVLAKLKHLLAVERRTRIRGEPSSLSPAPPSSHRSRAALSLPSVRDSVSGTRSKAG
eukprot:scaffold1954_cov268-Pinguiococcus_pyrenoidosus.AAC.135